MGLAVVVVLGALLVGRARGGSLRRLSATPLRARRLVVVAVVAQVGGDLAGLAGGATIYDLGLVISALAALAFCARNLRIAGLPLIGLGLTANALVVALNGAMPVSYDAAARAHADVSAVAAGADPRHALAGPESRLRWLGDVVPVALPLRGEVDSPGDVLIAAGLAQFVTVAMGRSAARRRRRPQWSAWRRRSVSAGPGPRTRPITASARTPDQPDGGLSFQASQALDTMSRRS